MSAARVYPARQPYQPSIESLIDHLPDLGESLQLAANALAKDCSLEGVDRMLARLETARAVLVRLRLALQQEQMK